MKKYIVPLVFLLLTVGGFVWFFSIGTAHRDYNSLNYGEDYSHLEMFFGDSFDYNTVNFFRTEIDNDYKQNSFSSEGRLWIDAFSGKPESTYVSYENTSFEAKLIVTGGEYFDFRDFEFLDGYCYDESDNFSDRVVIDELMSFWLYGSSNSVGMPLDIGGRTCYVAGVVKTPENPAYKLEIGENIPLAYMPYKLYNVINGEGSARFNYYEITLPDPVKDYAVTAVGQFITNAEIVNTTERYGFLTTLTNLKDMSKRSYKTSSVVYPYYENIAKETEDEAETVLFFTLIFAVAFIISLVIIIIIRRQKYEEVTRNVTHGVKHFFAGFLLAFHRKGK